MLKNVYPDTLKLVTKSKVHKGPTFTCNVEFGILVSRPGAAQSGWCPPEDSEVATQLSEVSLL